MSSLQEKICQTFCLQAWQGRKKVIQYIQVSILVRGKICAGTILPSFEHNWLVVMWQAWYTETIWIGWDLGVYGQCLGSGFMVKF